MSAAPLTVLHVWDHRVVNGQRDLHWSLCRQGVRSIQCVRALEMTGDHELVHTHALRAGHTGGSSSGFLRRLETRAWRLNWLRFERLVARQIAADRPDVLHAHFGTTGWKISRLAARLRIPLVVGFYGVDVSQMVSTPLWQRRYRALFPRAARLVVLCDAAAGRLAGLGCPPAKLCLWNHPVDLQAYRFRSHRPSGRTRLLIAARFVEKKGYPFLLEAVAELLRDGRDVSLTAVGYGPGRRHVEEQAAARGLGDRFRAIDTAGVANFDEFYSHLLDEHDVFVLPSTTAKSGDDEGGPALSLVLAQAAGLPVVCTPFAGAERSVFDNRTGLLCRQDDSASLASRIAELLDHPDVGARLAEEANRVVRDGFDLDTQAARMLAIYREAQGHGEGQGRREAHPRHEAHAQ